MLLRVFDSCNKCLDGIYCDHNNAEKKLVLEAGGGSFSHFLLPEHCSLVALDISYGQLSRNSATTVRVQGDLEHLPLKENSVDVAVCFNVIEHLDSPEQALEHLARSLRAGGVLILGCPDRISLKGFITRLTPLWFHRLYYRFVVGKKDRGEGHFDVFATPFRPIVTKKKLLGYLNKLGLSIAYLDAYDGASEFRLVKDNWKAKLVSVPYYGVAYVGQLLSCGKWNATDSDILLIATKK